MLFKGTHYCYVALIDPYSRSNLKFSNAFCEPHRIKFSIWTLRKCNSCLQTPVRNSFLCKFMQVYMEPKMKHQVIRNTLLLVRFPMLSQWKGSVWSSKYSSHILWCFHMVLQSDKHVLQNSGGRKKKNKKKVRFPWMTSSHRCHCSSPWGFPGCYVHEIPLVIWKDSLLIRSGKENHLY